MSTTYSAAMMPALHSILVLGLFIIQLPRLFLGSVFRKPTARKNTTLFFFCQEELIEMLKRIGYINPFAAAIFSADSDDDVFQKKIVEIDPFHEVARKKTHVIEFGKIEDMRL